MTFPSRGDFSRRLNPEFADMAVAHQRRVAEAALHADIFKARQRLSNFVREEAQSIARTGDVSWFFTSAEAPDTFEKLKAVYAQCAKHRMHLPIYDGASENTIYTSPYHNHCFRFWHDIAHIQLDLDFSFEGEADVARYHCDRVAMMFGMDSLEYKLMHIDTFGQLIYHDKTGKFVDNQLEFALNLLKKDLE